MQLHFFTIPVRDSDAATLRLNNFCSQNRVLTVDKQFVAEGSNSFWSLCVTTTASEKQELVPKRKPVIDYKEVLNESDFAVFAQLRQLRKTMAENEGVPAYALFTNEQLANMVTQRITTKTGLLELEGIGKSRVDKYAPAFLQILTTAWTVAGNETHKN